ncbi:conserved hypothetical protein [Serratia proteamaculans]|uniref:hypothetical protein n=1 Tax=Serratia proteamaculans TaxID=28151 RepID=UPI0009F7CB7D|nr:hypothetical protein [Serratia proteamaculans]SMB54598.1 conserved hypothetical protein [Serratia proteamaculans]
MSGKQYYTLVPTTRSVNIEKLRGRDRRMVAWWYCGFITNGVDGHQPSIKVEFRYVYDNNTVSENFCHIAIPVSFLAHVTIGSVWNKGICTEEIKFEQRHCDIPHPEDGDGWETIRSSDSPTPLFPVGFHRDYPADRNWLLSLQTRQGNRLLIPVEEFFIRCFGISQEVKRVLTTYRFQTAVHERLYAPPTPNEQEEFGPNVWPIRLRQRMKKDDAVMLAHAKFTDHGYQVLASIYTQLSHQFTNLNRRAYTPAFIKVIPWHKEDFKLQVRGIPFDNGRSFLVLRILGSSAPQCGGNTIERSMDTGDDFELPADKDDATAYTGAMITTLINPPDSILITDDINPDNNTQKKEVETPGLILIGKPSPVRDRVKRQADYTSGKKVRGESSNIYSSGRPENTGQGAGEFKSDTPLVIDTQGMLRNMWNACRELHRLYPREIISAEHFTFENGFSAGEEPCFISLQPLMESEPLAEKWCYVSEGIDKRLKCALIIRMQTVWGDAYIAETERSLTKFTNTAGATRHKEIPGRGLAFTLRQSDAIASLVKEYLSQIRYVKGIVHKLPPILTSEYTDQIMPFNHPTPKGPSFPALPALFNALRKLDIPLDDSRVKTW